MKKLEKNWITAPIIDTEYKQYILLAYIQEIKRSYYQLKIYPHLAELIDQYCELITLKDNQLALADKFPKTLKSIDSQEIKMIFSNDLTEENWVEEISRTIEMAIPFLQETIHQGKEIYEEIEKNIHMEPSGYNETLVYGYKVSLFESSEDKYRAIHTQYAAAFVKNLSVTNQYIKSEMIKQYPALPNPSVYAFESGFTLPVDDTYLPIVKRMITKIANM
jgi:hypothetical protein